MTNMAAQLHLPVLCGKQISFSATIRPQCEWKLSQVKGESFGPDLHFTFSISIKNFQTK